MIRTLIHDIHNIPTAHTISHQIRTHSLSGAPNIDLYLTPFLDPFHYFVRARFSFNRTVLLYIVNEWHSVIGMLAAHRSVVSVTSWITAFQQLDRMNGESPQYNLNMAVVICSQKLIYIMNTLRLTL